MVLVVKVDTPRTVAHELIALHNFIIVYIVNIAHEIDKLLFISYLSFTNACYFRKRRLTELSNRTKERK